MNLTNNLISFFSFKFVSDNDKDSFNRFLAVTVSSLSLIVYFFIQATIAFFDDSIISTAFFVSATLVLTINMLLLIGRKQIPFHGGILIIVAGLGFLFSLSTQSGGLVSSLIIALFPLMAIQISGYNRGATISILFLLLSAIVLFLTVEELASTSIVSKLIFILAYILILLFAYLLEIVKIRAIQDSEKQLLEHKSQLKLKEEFIANLSHQIRTPLNNIMVISSILETTNVDERQRDMLDTIQASTNNLVTVVNSMANISDIDIKERSILNIPFNLSNTISSTIRLFSTQNSSSTVFNLKVDESAPKMLSGDPVKLKQVFLNIIENILKNKSSGKTIIDIRISKAKDGISNVELLFDIKSNSPILLPVNEKHSHYITNETSYSSASTQIYIELLDLTITQKLIENNGGKLSISLTAENASFAFPYTFNKFDPTDLEKVEVITGTPAEKTQREQTYSKVDLENANILLVEDNLINQKIVVLSLKKLVKNIEIANNGKEALDKFGVSRFDLILMDIQMPIMNGIVTTKKIREIEASSNSHTPIIAITANALLGDKEECLSAGMDDYISKPFQIEVLIQKMKSLLKSS